MNDYFRTLLIEEIELMMNYEYNFIFYNMGSGGEFILTKILQYSDMNWWKPLFIIESNDLVIYFNYYYGDNLWYI